MTIRFLSPVKRPGFRPLAMVPLLIAQLMLAFGVPSFPLHAFSNSPIKDHSIPHPCMDLPCGCLTAEQCWAGACCCFTMRQKIAWAADHDFAPPEHALRIAKEEATSEEAFCPHCQPAEKQSREAAPRKKAGVVPHSVRWVVGPFAMDCQGQGMLGAFSAQPELPIDMSPPFLGDLSPTDIFQFADPSVPQIFEETSVPPPRQA